MLFSYSRRSGKVDEALAAIGRKRRAVAALPSFLLGSATVATLPSHAAVALCPSTTLRTFDLPMPMEVYPVSLAWRGDVEADPLNMWLRDLMRTTWRTTSSL